MVNLKAEIEAKRTKKNPKIFRSTKKSTERTEKKRIEIIQLTNWQR